MVWREGGQDGERGRRQQRGSERRESDAGTVRLCTVLVAAVKPPPRTASRHLRNLIRQPHERLHAARGEGRGTFLDDGKACGEACALLDAARPADRPTDRGRPQRRGGSAVGEACTMSAPRSRSESGARVARSTSVPGCETLTSQGHRGTLSSDASTRDAGFYRTGQKTGGLH